MKGEHTGHNLVRDAPARLAAAVLRQAVEDYYLGRQHKSIEARKWLEHSPRFLFWCNLAGVSASAERIRRHISETEPGWVINRRRHMAGKESLPPKILREMIALHQVNDLNHRPRQAQADATAIL